MVSVREHIMSEEENGFEKCDLSKERQPGLSPEAELEKARAKW